MHSNGIVMFHLFNHEVISDAYILSLHEDFRLLLVEDAVPDHDALAVDPAHLVQVVDQLVGLVLIQKISAAFRQVDRNNDQTEDKQWERGEHVYSPAVPTDRRRDDREEGAYSALAKASSQRTYDPEEVQSNDVEPSLVVRQVLGEVRDADRRDPAVAQCRQRSQHAEHRERARENAAHRRGDRRDQRDYQRDSPPGEVAEEAEQDASEQRTESLRGDQHADLQLADLDVLICTAGLAAGAM